MPSTLTKKIERFPHFYEPLWADRKATATLQKDMLQETWADLFRAAVKRFKRVYGYLRPKTSKSRKKLARSVTVTIHVKWLLVIVALFMLTRPATAVVVDQPQRYIKPVSNAKQLPQTKLQPQSDITVTYSDPTAITPVSGCVTYFSGNAYLDNIIRYESGGNSCATNPGGCFGLLQACPGQPLKDACGGDPACQIRWFIDNKTGGRSWAQVWQHELDFGWW